MSKIRVFISDWQVLFRQGVHSTLLSTDEFDIVGEDTRSDSALDFIRNNEPAMVIFNANSGSPSGIETAGRIKLNQPGIGILLLMDNYNESQVFDALKTGASDCRSKDMAPDELLSTVRKISRGETPITQALLDPEIARKVNEEFGIFAQLNDECGDMMAPLLPVEEQIIQYIIHGDAPQEIAANIEIAEEDVVRHLHSVHQKLVMNSRSREVLETVQGNVDAMISKISRPGKSGRKTADYITREEFNAFKESLQAHFKSLSANFG